MCVACLEYTKGKLNTAEFTAAMREMTEEDKEHGAAVARLLQEFASDPDRLKKELEALSRN